MKEKNYLALLHYLGFSQRQLLQIFIEKENYKEFYEKIDEKVLKAYINKEEQRKFILERYCKTKIYFIEDKLEERNVEIITIKDNNYPKNLKEIPNPPYLLYVRGKIDEAPKIAVVGSRNITSYGEKVIADIVPELSKYFIIVSGGAYGCDTNAHLQTLKSGNKTISVIGTGIDIDYPVGNKRLYDEIVEKSGAVISIFPVSEVGNSYNFPVRNEIVAGLSVGTVVIEAKEKSGSLITSKLTLDLGKDLFAVPGDIFKSNSAGCNKLIYAGEAKIIRNTTDILEEYNISGGEKKVKEKIKFADKIEENIYNELIIQSLTIDEISLKLKLDISTLSFKISMMEISGIVGKSLGGKYEIN